MLGASLTRSLGNNGLLVGPAVAGVAGVAGVMVVLEMSF